MVFDEARAEIVLFGGFDLDYSDETWLWNGGPLAQPAQVFSTTFASAQGPGVTACLGGTAACPISRVAISWHAGGEARPSGSPVPGSRLLGWQGNAWALLDTNAQLPDAPTELSWEETANAQLIGRLFFGDQQSLSFAVTPVDSNGSSTPQGVVATEYVEVTVEYRLE
jgi:hypothetical protein